VVSAPYMICLLTDFDPRDDSFDEWKSFWCYPASLECHFTIVERRSLNVDVLGKKFFFRHNRNDIIAYNYTILFGNVSICVFEIIWKLL